MVYPRYDLMIGDVRASQSEMETTFNDAQEGIESAASKLYSKDPARAKEFLTNYTNMTAQSTLDTWKRLGEFLTMTCFQFTPITGAMFMTGMAANPLCATLAKEGLGIELTWVGWF